MVWMCIVVSPDHDTSLWLALVNEDAYNRVSMELTLGGYLTGLSMGGFGTYYIALDHPERFAAIVPICGGLTWWAGFHERAAALKDMPVWVFHGAKDETVPVEASQEAVDALKAVGNDARFTVYPEAGHDSWTETYNNPELYTWLLGHSR